MGSRIGVWRLGALRAWHLGFRMWGLEIGVQGLGFRVYRGGNKCTVVFVGAFWALAGA